METFEFTGLVPRGEKPIHERYRPCTFHEVIGNEPAKHALAGWMAAGARRSGALLLTGPSGCGKTTIARILAMGLNCERGDTVNPCCECPSCKAAMDKSAMHIVEMNMSATTGKDDAEQTVMDMYNNSFTGRNNVYILDESQGMSKSAQNLILKTLEEPPENTYIFMMTTEPEKIIKTIKTRCEQYLLQLPSQNEIKQLLGSVVKQEMPEMGIESRKAILEACKGLGYREILKKLDKFMKGGGTDSIADAFQPDMAKFAKAVVRGDFMAAKAEIDAKENFDCEGARMIARTFLANEISSAYARRDADGVVRACNAMRYFDHGFYTDPRPRPSLIADLAMACLIMGGQFDPTIVTTGNR